MTFRNAELRTADDQIAVGDAVVVVEHSEMWDGVVGIVRAIEPRSARIKYVHVALNDGTGTYGFDADNLRAIPH